MLSINLLIENNNGLDMALIIHSVCCNFILFHSNLICCLASIVVFTGLSKRLQPQTQPFHPCTLCFIYLTTSWTIHISYASQYHWTMLLPLQRDGITLSSGLSNMPIFNCSSACRAGNPHKLITYALSLPGTIAIYISQQNPLRRLWTFPPFNSSVLTLFISIISIPHDT